MNAAVRVAAATAMEIEVVAAAAMAAAKRRRDCWIEVGGRKRGDEGEGMVRERGKGEVRGDKRGGSTVNTS